MTHAARSRAYEPSRSGRRTAVYIAAGAVATAGFMVGPPDVSAVSQPAASAVLADPPQFDGMNGEPGDANTSVSDATTKFEGRSCWFANPEVGNDFLYFAVDDARVPENANTAFVTIEYFDGGPGDFTIHYDGEDRAFTRADTVSMTGDSTWKSTRLRLDDIRFDGRTNDHDFRISSWDQRFGTSDTPVCVGEIQVAFDYIPPDLEVLQQTPGNVFTQPETPAVDIETRGDTVSWEIHNFWGERVAHGVEDVGSDSTLTLNAPVDEVGYYRLDLTAELDGSPIAETTTDMALVAPFDVADVPESPFGTVPHSTREDNFDTLRLAATMGAKNVREAALWFSVEPEERGEYSFHRYDPMVDALNDEGMRWMPVASYINDLYDGNATPYTDDGRAGYAEYIASVADHYRGEVAWIEIYNEFNIKQFGARGGSPANAQANYYFPMLKQAYQKIKAANPDVTVIGGATSSVSLDWLEELFSLGGLKYMDAVSVHPYVFPSDPETAAEQLSELKKLIRKYNDGELIPIWITEQGYPTNDHAKGVSEATQAANVVRTNVVALSEGVEKIFWYNLMNQGTNNVTPNHNYGLIRNGADERGRYVPKPGYVSYATMTRQLTDSHHVRDESVGGVTSHVFRRDGENVRVIWSKEPATVAVRTEQPVTVTDLMGESRTYRPHAGLVHLSVSETPVYVSGSGVKLVPGDKLELTAGGGDDVIVGDEIRLTLEVDNAIPPRAPIDGTFEIAGTSVDVSVRPGEQAEIPIRLPAETVTGMRSLIGQLTLGDQPSARLSVDVEVTQPVEVSARHVLVDGADALTVDLTNRADREITVGDLGWEAAGLSGSVALPETLPASSTRAVTVPLADLPDGSHDYRLELPVQNYDDVAVTGQVDSTDQAQLAQLDERSVMVDGVLDDMTGVSGVDLSLSADGKLGGRWTTATEDAWIYGGEDDLSGNIWPTWDEENLYLSARITDDAHHQHHPASIVWQGDSISFTLSPGMPDEERPQRYYEYRMALGEDGPVLYRDVSADEDVPVGQVHEAELEIVRDDEANETVYELAVPWSALKPAEPEDRLMSMSLRTNDNDGLDRKGWLQWTLRPAILQPGR